MLDFGGLFSVFTVEFKVYGSRLLKQTYPRQCHGLFHYTTGHDRLEMTVVKSRQAHVLYVRARMLVI